MLTAVDKFAPDTLPTWKWTAWPGIYERYLQRRHNNCLFNPARSLVTASDVYLARCRDVVARDDSRRAIAEIKAQLRRKVEEKANAGNLNELRERLDIVLAAIRHSGKNSSDLEDEAMLVRRVLTDIWREACKDNPSVLSLLDESDAVCLEEQRIMFASEWLRHMGHPEKVIPHDEICASLLSEEIHAIGETIRVLNSEPRLQSMLLNVRTGALDVVRAAHMAGYDVTALEEKLEIIGVAL